MIIEVGTSEVRCGGERSGALAADIVPRAILVEEVVCAEELSGWTYVHGAGDDPVDPRLAIDDLRRDAGCALRRGEPSSRRADPSTPRAQARHHCC